MLLKSVVIFFLVAFHHEASGSAFLNMKNVIDFANFLTSTIESLSFWVGALEPRDKIPQEILDSIHDVSTQLDQMGIQLNQKLDMLGLNLPKQIRNAAKVDREVDDIVKNMRDINYLYKTYFVNIMNSTLSNYTLQSFINTVTGTGSESPIKMVQNIYSHFYTGELGLIRDSLLHTMIELLKQQGLDRCDELQSPQQWLYEVYSLINTVEIRSLVMVTAAFKMRSVSTGESHDSDIARIKDQYLNRINSYMYIMKEALKSMPNDIRRCDPPEPIIGKTYIEYKKFSQAVLVNSDQLDPENCQKCSSFNGRTGYTKKNPGSVEKFDGFCSGTLLNCQEWSAKSYTNPPAHQVEVCKMPRSSGRLYQYFKDSDGHISGRKTDTCPGAVVNDLPMHMTRKWCVNKFGPIPCGFYYCAHCLCTCQRSVGVFYPDVPQFDSSIQKSDCKSNMVVTGVKIVRKSEVTYISVKQGKLTAGGRILPGSESWVPVDNSQAKDSFKPRKLVRLRDAVIPSNSRYVITGVGFDIGPRDSYSIQVLANKFNETTGDIDCGQTQIFKASQSAAGQNQEVDVSNLDNPSFYNIHKPDEKTREFVQFQHTSIPKDAGQTVVPLLESQLVYTSPPAPLRGIGMYYKGAPSSGGYIALRALTLNMGDFLDNGGNPPPTAKKHFFSTE